VASARFLHDEFAALALVGAESFIAAFRPAFRAVEQVADHYINRADRGRRWTLSRRSGRRLARRARRSPTRTSRSASSASPSAAGAAHAHHTAVAALGIGGKTAHLEHELTSAEIEARGQGIGRLLIVVIHELAAESDRGLRPFRIAHAPARDPHL